jgi:redox-sensitive bicupin YhaK (pirin superfamily)
MPDTTTTQGALAAQLLEGGRLAREDSEGNKGEIVPGLAQRMTAGTGIEHAERNPSTSEPVHVVQMWVPPDRDGLAPGYEQTDVREQLAQGGLLDLTAGPIGSEVLVWATS